MIVVRNNDYIVAYRNNKLYEQENPKISSLDDIYITQPSNKDVYLFYVSGTTYKERQQSAYAQCIMLLEALKKYECSTQTLFMIVGWIERNASHFGLHKRLKKERYDG